MKKTLLTLSLGLLLTGCNSDSNAGVHEDIYVYQDPVMYLTDTGYTSTWWELPNQYYNGVPKYSGAFGTYTHKHIPLAVKSYFGDIFSVRTDNTVDGNFYVYAMKNNQSVLVHTIENWDDPHTNAIIHILNTGHVEVRIASRGLAHKFQSGVVLRSQTPFELDFQCVEGCSPNDVNYEAYPQMHYTGWGNHLIYTKYEQINNQGMNYRNLYSRIGNNHKKLSNLAHYNVSYYDPNMDQLCVASNTLLGGSPENRVNLSVICTEYGQDTWKTTDNKLIDFNSQDESNRIVYNTQNLGTYVYLKDMIAVAGKMRVLFTETDSTDPTTGTRWLSEWIQGEGVSKIAQVGHNYSAGAYLKKNGKLFIVAGVSNSTGYLSGSLELYDTDYTLIDTAQGDYSYVRRVRYGDGEAVLSEGASDINTGGRHYTLKLD